MAMTSSKPEPCRLANGEPCGLCQLEELTRRASMRKLKPLDRPAEPCWRRSRTPRPLHPAPAYRAHFSNIHMLPASMGTRSRSNPYCASLERLRKPVHSSVQHSLGQPFCPSSHRFSLANAPPAPSQSVFRPMPLRSIDTD